MKKFSSFIAGVLTTAIVGSISISALAASGAMTISVNPINIQVNGETFAPKDVNGKSVPVFAYNGTTYAPLRALAEAYGLEVGYDANSNMATVTSSKIPDESTQNNIDEEDYNIFKNMWDISFDQHRAYLVCKNNSLLDFLNNHTKDEIISYTKRFGVDVINHPDNNASMLFLYYYYKDTTDEKNALWEDIVTEKEGVVSSGYENFRIEDSVLKA